MQIDWLTVGAQIVNFLVLVWLLQRFLYQPITRAMERREERIRDRLREAEAEKEQAENEARLYRRRQEELAEQRALLFAEAREAAGEERKALERQAREEVEAHKREWQRQLDSEQDAFLRDLRRRSTEQFYALARRVLGDLADAELEEQIARGFLRQWDGIDGRLVETVAREAGKAGGAVAIRSRFALSAAARRQITRAVRQRLGDALRVDYEAAEAGPCGIELKAGGQTISWTLDSYLDGFEKAVDEQFAAVSVGAEEQPRA